jgi:organic hydroperoxide reductase OsmC/OhrA
MGEYRATIEWERDGAAFLDNRYSRGHRWSFDAGITLRASSSPQVVPIPMSVEAAVDPEEAFVASLSSCHMLSFLYVAKLRGVVVDAYRDEAIGTLGKNAAGRIVVTRVVLRPRVTFAPGTQVAAADFTAMHHQAHDECFIAGSVLTDVRCEPEIVAAP